MKSWRKFVDDIPRLEHWLGQMTESQVQNYKNFVGAVNAFLWLSSPLVLNLVDVGLGELDNILLLNPFVRLRREIQYLKTSVTRKTPEDAYWEVELDTPEFFNLKDALVVNGFVWFYEQGGPVLKGPQGVKFLQI